MRSIQHTHLDEFDVSLHVGLIQCGDDDSARATVPGVHNYLSFGASFNHLYQGGRERLCDVTIRDALGC